MNIVQIGDKLRHLPISILRSEDIVVILSKVNTTVPPEHHITALSTGNDLYKMFNSMDAETQSKLLVHIFNSRRESAILNLILEETSKQDRKDDTAKNKWSSVQGSIVLIGFGFVISVLWMFANSHGEKPPIPDAVVGNMVTQLMQAGVDLLVKYLTGET